MKSQSITSALIFSLLALFGCEKDDVNPIVSFTINKSVVEVGEPVAFSNLSENATEYIWDFGDGNASAETNPTHIYKEIGTYTIKLNGYGNENSDLSTEIIEVVPANISIEPGVRVGDFYLNDDLATHFAKLDENRMNYLYLLGSNGENLHIFSFSYAGISFYVQTPTKDYTMNDVPNDIHAYAPFEGQAMGRITLGSSFVDVVNVFGTPLDIFSTGEHFYDGVIFYADDSKLLVDRISVR